MVQHPCQSLQEFRWQLEATGSDYLVTAEDNGRQRVEIRFTGSFRGSEVIWSACLLALGNEPGVSAECRQFIDVTHRNGLDYDLTVGLAVPVIDTATILKTIIMIRKYKRLRIGHHEFGSGAM